MNCDEIASKMKNQNFVTEQSLKDKIIGVEYVVHTTNSEFLQRPKILRWCVLILENGFTVSGDYSACVDPLNDIPEIGEQIAYENAFRNLWQLEGYLLQEKLFNDIKEI